MRLTLLTYSGPDCVLGELQVGGNLFRTVERPWLSNERVKSCVPEGFYALEPHLSDRFGETYALVGETVSHYEEPGVARYAILFHAGNTVGDVKGCIAVGQTFEAFGDEWDEWGVTHSKHAMNELRDALKGSERHYLNIIRRR